VIAGLGKLAAHYNDAQAMLLIGKTPLVRGLPMDVYAFPDVGVPNCSPIGPKSMAASSMSDTNLW
jgi:soluble lytic murein transglycosylase